MRVKAGRGFFVRDITLNDIKGLFETLLVLERAAIALAVRRIESAGIGRLERFNDCFKAAWDRHHVLDVTLANSRFHREIYAATGNEYMQSYLGSLQTQSQRLAYICFTYPADLDLNAHADESIRDHGMLIACLEKDVLYVHHLCGTPQDSGAIIFTLKQ